MYLKPIFVRVAANLAIYLSYEMHFHFEINNMPFVMCRRLNDRDELVQLLHRLIAKVNSRHEQHQHHNVGCVFIPWAYLTFAYVFAVSLLAFFIALMMTRVSIPKSGGTPDIAN